MRRIIPMTLVLLPLFAQAQANAKTEPQPAVAPATMQARLSKPANPANASDASIPAITSVRSQIIHESVVLDFSEQPLPFDSSLSYTFYGGGPNTSVETPKIVHSSEIPFTYQQAVEQAAESNVAVRMTVDLQGVPHSLIVERSGGAFLDKQVLNALSQYRFQPAKVNHMPVEMAFVAHVKIIKK